jgi:Tfp pilus assembly protein PilW
MRRIAWLSPGSLLKNSHLRLFQQAATPASRGLSLVELLISMLLGLILTSGIVSVYLGSKQNYFYEEQAARIQENGRYAMRLLQRELSMAGFFGGVLSMDAVMPASVGTDCSTTNWALDGHAPVELVNDYSGQSNPVSLNATGFTCLDGAGIVPFTDILAIKRTASEASLRNGVPIAGLTASTGEQWYLRLAEEGDPKWQKLRPVDLLGSTIAGAPLTYWEASSKIFYIRRYSDSGAADDRIPTLCMENLAGNAVTSRCLVEGVENMQLEFGIDTDGDGVANQYKVAPTGAEMDQAVTARIYLLLRSILQIAGYRDDRNYVLGQKAVAARYDGFLRRVFSTTVRLRNRIEPVG